MKPLTRPLAGPLAWLVFVPLVASCRPAPDGVAPPAGQLAANDGASDPRAGQGAPTGPLDAAVRQHWRDAGVQPVGDAGEAEYLRRVTLDLAGRIPTPSEVSSYAADTSPDKREHLVERLLHGEEFAAHWADIYAELLLAGASKIPPPIERGTRDWLSTQLAADASWESMARQILTASGPLDNEGPGGFVTVHGRNGRVEALTGATARVFMGTSIQCAQCHDHPTDERVSQRDFYALAAYYARTKPRFKKQAGGGRSVTIVDKRRGEMRLPTPTDAPGLRSGPTVEPAFEGEAYEDHREQTRREALADAIVDSPLFAKAAVGRVWTQLFGRGPVDPWDDLGAADDPKHPPLLDALAEHFVRSDHDLRALLQAIVLSEAYTRTSAGADDGATARRRAFAQFPVRPMTTQQLVRSLLVATGRKADTLTQRERNVARITAQARKAHLVEHGDDEGLSADTFSGSVPQALFLLGGPLTVKGSKAGRGTTLAEILRDESDTAARIDAVMRATVARDASDAEQTRFSTYIHGSDAERQAYEDVMHAVLVSSEFLSVH